MMTLQAFARDSQEYRHRCNVRVTGLPSRQSFIQGVQADDIDPWFERGYGYSISDKAGAVGSTASEMKSLHA